MHMMLKKRQCKLVALFLLIVFLVPFVPVAPVSADVEQPEFPYGVNVFHSTNTGSFALWKVYGSDKVSYVQTYSNVSGDGSAFPVVFRSGLGWSSYYYYINYEKIIDTWDNEGNHIDSGYSWSQNIRIPAPNETTVDSGVYATLVYCTTDIYHGNGYGDNEIYAYQNFIVPGYADPTPTPAPTPEIDNKFPTFINAYKDNYLNGYNRAVTKYFIANRYYDESNSRYEYVCFFASQRFNPNLFGKEPLATPNYNGYDFANDTLTFHFLNDAERNYSCIYGDGFILNESYFTESDVYDCSNLVSSYPALQMTETTTRNYQFTFSDSSMNYEATAIYLINSDGSTTRLDGQGGGTSATPTPTAVPTAIPQPSISPTPTDPPETGDDNNYTGLFGWLKRIRDAILNIPKKIVNGILDALKYIFVPDMNKVKQVYSDLNDKFGIQKPAKFEFDPAALTRPHNVYFYFHSIPINGQESETTKVTIIDFKKVDDWLDTSAGHMIIKICKACFSLLLWAYMIYVFTKHIGSINYTDAQRLEGVYKRSNEVEGDDTDV